MSQTKTNTPAPATELLTVEAAAARIAQLEDQVAGQLTEIAQNNELIKELESQARAADDARDELQQLFDEQATMVGTLESQKEALEASNADLTAQLQQLKAKPADHPIVEVEGKSYYVTVPTFQYRKIEYTAADLAKNSALAAELVAKKMGFLQPLTAAE